MTRNYKNEASGSIPIAAEWLEVWKWNFGPYFQGSRMTGNYENEASGSIPIAAEWLEVWKLLALFPQQLND